MNVEATSLAGQLVSGHWYRVAGVAPCLRQQLRVHVHHYRGQPWRVVEDRLSGRFHRFDRAAWRIIGLLDGQLTLDQLWRRLASEAGEHTPSQDELLTLLGQLHGLDLLAPGSLPDLAELGRRDRRQAGQRLRARYLNPLALRLRLLDPDRLLTWLVAALRPLLNRRGAALWLAWVLPAVLLAFSHSQELGGNFAERLLTLDNLVLLWVAFPLVKGLHELGHGIACKLRGGEVHDMGLMLLIFLPVPYVDASSAWAFADKRDRMLVGAAGMLAELALAAGAFYLWLWLEPGLVRSLAYNVAVLAGVTTLLFNANPLLRYDGYYMASDALEIPNLAQRASRYWAYLFERRLLGRRQAVSPATAPGEAVWLAVYAPLAFAYRMFVLVTIALFVATQYLAVGVAMAVWSLYSGLALPLWRGVQWLRQQLGGGAAPARGRRVVLGLAAALLALVTLVPLPLRTQADGVLWLPDSGVVRAAQAGFVSAVAVTSGDTLAPGDLILRLHDPVLASRALAQAGRVAASQARLDAARATDPARTERARAELARDDSELVALRDRMARLSLRSAASGRLWLNNADDLDGRLVKQGQVVGYVVPATAPVLRVIVDQVDADLISAGTRHTTVRLPFAPGQDWSARLLRAVPAASNDLPSAALGRQGGGTVATDPRDDSGRRALATHFELELALPDDFPFRLIGSRASVRFEHAPEPLVRRLWRGLRQLFLAQFQS